MNIDNRCFQHVYNHCTHATCRSSFATSISNTCNIPLKHLKHLKQKLATCSFSANIFLLIRRIDTRQHVEFVGGSGSAMLVGSGSAVATRQGREASASRRTYQGAVAKRRDSQVAAHLAGPTTAPLRLHTRLPRAETRRGQRYTASSRAGNRALHARAEPRATYGGEVEQSEAFSLSNVLG
jgi:hypothetical protein